MRTIIIALGVILFLQCCILPNKPLEPEGVLLTQGELEQLFKNEITFIFPTTNKSKDRENAGEMTCYPNGTLQWVWIDMGDRLSGTYRIVNGQKCDNYLGAEECWKFYKISEKKYYIETVGGSKSHYITEK